MALSELGVAFFLQVFAIVAARRAMGWIMKRLFDQPQVVGEMIAGVILGPSLLGLLAPERSARARSLRRSWPWLSCRSG